MTRRRPTTRATPAPAPHACSDAGRPPRRRPAVRDADLRLAGRPGRRTRGATLLELLLVLAIAALLAGLVAAGTGDGAAAAARAVEALARSGRTEALLRGVPVAFGWEAETDRFVLRRGVDAVEACRGGRVVEAVALGDFGRVRLAAPPRDDLVWMPSGLGRGCRSGGAYNRTLVLRGPGGDVAVLVSRAGRIRMERR